MIASERKDIKNLDNFEEYLESIDNLEKCSFFRLPPKITVGQTKKLFNKYLTLLDENSFLVRETKNQLKILSYYPDHWLAAEAFQVEGVVCNHTKS